MSLAQYVLDHSLRDACRCGKCIDPGNPDVALLPHTIDMYFFNVCVVNNPQKEEFLDLISKHRGDFCEVNPCDGNEHSYIELGGWIGDQGLAMQFMGLGALLGVWQIMHPGKILDVSNPEQKVLADQMAGMGLVSILPCKKS